MFKNYLKIAFRNIAKHKTFSFINIAGLAIGMACTILIVLWVQDELSYDHFHQHANDIYRVVSTLKHPNKADYLNDDETPAPLGRALQEDFPEIIKYARVNYRQPKVLFRYQDKMFYEQNIAIADPSFFEIFTFEFILGDAKTALENTYGIVLTESMAEKYFGEENPLGKRLESDWGNYEVTGVIRDIPQNSHIRFDFMYSLKVLEKHASQSLHWMNWNYITYIQVKPQTDIPKLTEKMTGTLTKNVPQIFNYFDDIKLLPQSLGDIHLYSNFLNDQVQVGHIKYVYIFTFVAFLILAIACINFINLSTARSAHRAKEVGLRKVIGSGRKQLISQFLGESMFLVLIAFFLALILAELLFPLFNHLAGKNLSLNYSNPWYLLSALALIIITGVLAGFFPAFYLSGFHPANILKGIRGLSPQGFLNRKVLVVTQFTLSIGLIIGAMTVHQQLTFMTGRKLGFNKENVVYIPARENIASKFPVFRQKLLQNQNIRMVTAKDYMPTDHITTNTIRRPEQQQENILAEVTYVDKDYFKTLEMSITDGRNFSDEYPTDAENAVILDESTVQLLRLESPVGKSIREGERLFTIVGVAQSSYFRSFKNEMLYPQVYHLLPDPGSSSMYATVLIKINNEQISNTITSIEKLWYEMNPDIPFEYHFLDETIDRVYREEIKMGQVMNYFSFFSIMIACLGLFGLASYMIEQRTKEIGVRKVLGATVFSIVRLLSKEFVKWVILANIIAWPLIYLMMNRWLQDYAFRIRMSPLTFIFAGLIALVIALFTVSWQAIRAATANPVEALRYE